MSCKSKFSELTAATEVDRADASLSLSEKYLMNDQINENMNAPSEICLPHCEFLFAYGI